MALLESRILFSGLASRPGNPLLGFANKELLRTHRQGQGSQLSTQPRLLSYRFNPRCLPEPPRSSSEEPDSDNSNVDWDRAWQTRNSKSDAASSPPDTPTAAAEESSDSNNSNGPRLTQWGGAVRGGKYQLGEGADGILDLWGNGDALLFAALVVLSLFCVLLNFIPPAPR